MSQEHDIAWTQCAAAELQLRFALPQCQTAYESLDERARSVRQRFLLTSKLHLEQEQS